MAYVDIVTVLALIQFFVLLTKVGKARVTFGVAAPATTGNEIFERHFRVQQNTLEQLVMLVPGLYLFSRYFNPLWAAALGVVYLIGREIYAVTYVRNPAKRGPGFGLTLMPVLILLAGGGIGALLRLIRP